MIFKIQQQMENTRQASQLPKVIQSHKKVRNSDQVSPISSKTNLRNASARTNQSRTQKTNEKAHRQTVTRKQKYINQNQSLAERLLMATFFDVQDTQRNFSNYIKNRQNKGKIDIPKMFYLITLHEKLFNRAYSEQLKYYIVGLLWDQGLVEVGQTKKWEENINEMLQFQQNNELGSQLLLIDEIREKSIQKASSELMNIGNNKQKIRRSFRNCQINGQLLILLQSIEQQYHRQQITLRHFISQNKADKQMQMYDKICNMYSCLDQSHFGSVMIDELFSKFAPIGKQLSIETRYFILNRIINNLHIYDQHRHTIINPTHSIKKQTSTDIRVTIQQMMELINRVYQQSGDMSFHPCQTFRAIHYIMSRYEQLVDATRKKSFDQQKGVLQSRNKQLIIASKMQHIRQAAADIVQQGKINGLNYTSRFRENIASNEKQYETEKNIGEMMIDEQNTFRGNKKLKPQNLFTDQSKIKRFQYDQSKQGSKQRENKATSDGFSNKMKDAKNLTDLTKKTNMTWNIQTSKIGDKYWDKSPQIKEFEISDQINSSKLNGIDESMVREQMELKIKEQNAKYDRLLRERILTQLEIVRLQRIRNRIRYYDVAFQFQ